MFWGIGTCSLLIAWGNPEVWLSCGRRMLRYISEPTLGTIDVEIHDRERGNWRCTGIYGWPGSSEKRHTMDLLKRLNEDLVSPWLCMGDFNIVSSGDGKSGGSALNFSRIVEFRKTIESCELREVRFVGDRYTWDNEREGEELIKERLDLAFCNESFLERHPRVVVHHLPRCGSDHCPILVSLEGEKRKTKRGPKPFRFEAMWLTDEHCLEVIQNGWQNPGSSHVEKGVKGKVAR